MSAKQIRDFRCPACERVVTDHVSAYGDWPVCACGAEMRVTWERGKCPALDAYGVPVYSDATGQYHTSTRDRERAMRELGFHPAGDKVGGARTDLSIRGTGFSYGGQASRVSTGERRT